MDGGGQEGFFDAMLFLAIMSVTSCMIISSAATLIGPDDTETREDALRYARQSLDSLMASTMAETYYLDHGGRRLIMGNNTTVEGFLLAETYLIMKGWREDAFRDCNLKIERMARELLSGAYDFALEAGPAVNGGAEASTSLGNHHDSPGYAAVSIYSLDGASVWIRLTLWWT